MLEDISGLRWAGIVVGLLISLLGARQFRRHGEGHGTAIMMVLLGIVVFLVATFPALGRVPAEILSLTRIKGGVVISLLLIAVTLAWLLLFWNRYKIEYLRNRLNNTIHGLAMEAFDAESIRNELASKEIAWVVIPAFNEAENIPHVLEEMPLEVLGRPVEVLLVDDGSSDGTGEAARSGGAQVLRMPVNAGQGSALRAGYDAAVRCGADIVATLDADGQNSPAELEGLLEPLVKGEADIVIGSRVLGKHEHTSLARSVGVHVFNLVLWMITGTKFTDCASSFRAFTASVLREVKLVQEQYQSTEILIEAAKRGYRITERPITFRRRKFGNTKKGGNLRYGALFFRTIVKTWLR